MRVAIVDDSSFICLVCRQIIEKSGYEVVGESFDGEDCIDLVKETKPDLILMDMALPKQSGIQAIKKIKKIFPNQLFLGISAIDEDWLREEAIESGCFGFLENPFESRQLISYLEEAESLLSTGEVKYG